MQSSKNLCHFEGRIIKDPVFSQQQIGNDMVNKVIFTIAVDKAMTSAERAKAKQENKPTAEFVTFSALGRTADFVQNYLPKGKAVSINASYTTYQSQDRQTGQTKYGHIFNVNQIEFGTQDAKSVSQNGNNGGGYQQNNNGYQQQGYNNGYQQQGYNNQPQQQQPQQQSQQNNNGFSLWDDNQNPFF